MTTQIVVEVYEYEADTPEEAEQALRPVMDAYEHPHFVYAASSLDDLPHPMQLDEIDKAFGDGAFGD